MMLNCIHPSVRAQGKATPNMYPRAGEGVMGGGRGAHGARVVEAYEDSMGGTGTRFRSEWLDLVVEPPAPDVPLLNSTLPWRMLGDG